MGKLNKNLIVFRLILLCWLLGLTELGSATKFAGKDVTSMLFANNEDIFPMAYGDFNADKLTDVFTVSRDHSTLKIYFGSPEPPLLRPVIQCKLIVDLTPNGYPGKKSRVNIVGVTPGDFNGDSLMDVMVSFRRSNVTPPAPESGRALNSVEVVVFPGNGTNLNCVDGEQMKSLFMAQEPMMLDVNGDMVMDLFSEVNRTISSFNISGDGNWTHTYVRDKYMWIFDKGDGEIISNPTPVNLSGSFNNSTFFDEDDDPTAPLASPHSSAFVDSDGDLAPELVFITQRVTFVNTTKKTFNVRYTVKTYNIRMNNQTSPAFTLAKSPVIIDRTNTTLIVGQSIFIDMNHDGILDHVIPTNSRHTGGDSAFYVIPGNKDKVIFKLAVNFKSDLLGAEECHFVLPFHGLASEDSNYTRSIVLRPGDFNLDGFPDLVGVIVSTSAPRKQFPVLFENVPCQKPNCDFPRSFKINFEDISHYQNATLATFFDINEDGLVDILLVRETSSDQHKYMTKYGAFAFQNSPDYDANFMKVMVLSGNPCPKCTASDGIPYGSIIPGPVVQYAMTTQAGYYEKAIAAQLYRTSFQALDLPYIIFGIGQSPNFVETLTVSVFPTTSNNRTHEWLQIIPNSQILVVPSPLDKEWLWKAKLFLTPSKARLYTFGVLVGFCGIIFLIVVLLQVKERREDRKERLEEAHRFHMM